MAVSLAGRLEHLLMVIIRAVFSKLYLVVKKMWGLVSAPSSPCPPSPSTGAELWRGRRGDRLIQPISSSKTPGDKT